MPLQSKSTLYLAGFHTQNINTQIKVLLANLILLNL